MYLVYNTEGLLIGTITKEVKDSDIAVNALQNLGFTVAEVFGNLSLDK